MIKKLLILIIISILLISCFELDSVIDIKGNGEGLWNLRYRISQEAVFINPGTEFSDYNYFPVSEDELRKRISDTAGLELLKVSVEETAKFIEYSVEMSFLNTGNIQSFFNNYAGNPVIEIGFEEDGVFRLTIEKPFNLVIDQETLGLISALYSTNMINIVVAIPGIVTDSSKGSLSEDPRKAAFEMRTMDAVTMLEPIEWIINYE